MGVSVRHAGLRGQILRFAQDDRGFAVVTYTPG